jgi:hypothetical protein
MTTSVNRSEIRRPGLPPRRSKATGMSGAHRRSRKTATRAPIWWCGVIRSATAPSKFSAAADFVLRMDERRFTEFHIEAGEKQGSRGRRRSRPYTAIFIQSRAPRFSHCFCREDLFR